MSSVVAYIVRKAIYDGSYLPFIPAPVKGLLLCLLLLQLPTFPFSWHIGVFRHIIARNLWRRYRGHRRYLAEWETSPAAKQTTKHYKHQMTRRVHLAQADYNMHMSNSCYALNADAARVAWMVPALGPYLSFGTGAYVALGGSHFVYLKEIPIWSKYVMETSLVGWGDKWIYGVVEYIIYPKRKGSRKSTKTGATTTTTEVLERVNEKLAAHTMPTTTVISPTPTPPSALPGATPGEPITLESAKKAALVRARKAREDGGVVACLAVFDACFKIDRITIPPRIVMHYALQSPDPAARAPARQICLSKDNGRAWLKGGWKKEPNAATLGLEVGPEGEEGNGEWFSVAAGKMEPINEGLLAL